MKVIAWGRVKLRINITCWEVAEIARVAPAARLKGVTFYYKKKAKLLNFSERIKHRQWWVEDIALVLF